MEPLDNRLIKLWNKIRESKTQIKSSVAIPDYQTDMEEKLQVAFKPNEHYFGIRVNEIYLNYKRKWFSEYEPMVFTISEFMYNKDYKAVPFVVGKSIMEKYHKVQQVPTGMIFSDTRVAGLHPYRGGRLSFSVILYRVKGDDYAKKLLQIVEGIANVLDFSTALNTYVEVANIMLDGVEVLLGSNGSEPIIGFRKEFDPDAGEILKPGYFALIDMPESELRLNELWVRERRLFYGKSFDEAEPFRDADYVLYSITQVAERSDLEMLPFNELYKRMIKKAMKSSTNECWEATKADMTTLYQSLRFSPDLTLVHANQLREKYKDEMKREHAKAVADSKLGSKVSVDPELRDAVGILKL